MKKIMLIIALMSVAIVSHTTLAKVTIEDGYKSEADYYKSVKDNQAEYEKGLYTGLQDPQNSNKPENLVYVGSGNKRLTETGFYVIDTSASGNRTTSSIYVPSLSGTYYGTSGTSSNSAVGVKVVNGVLRGYGNVSTPSITGIYKLK
ncbi:hypothetical protein [Vibrio echinoideorum]|uniref:hypothetical protein n=1 Tax=Vibrio echinoideorum TaxID=2100116 RepID=UPI0035517553